MFAMFGLLKELIYRPLRVLKFRCNVVVLLVEQDYDEKRTRLIALVAASMTLPTLEETLEKSRI